jgi:hypothetical protein
VNVTFLEAKGVTGEIKYEIQNLVLRKHRHIPSETDTTTSRPTRISSHVLI